MGKYYEELFYLIFNQRTIVEKQELLFVTVNPPSVISPLSLEQEIYEPPPHSSPFSFTTKTLNNGLY